MKIRDNRIIFKALVGSHAYGTNVEGSDYDYKGVYLQDPKDVLENGYCEQIDVTKDEVYFELGRFVELCCTGNPTMLELLFSPSDCVVFEDPLWDIIKSVRSEFLTKQCRLSFGGYAISQIRKASGLDKKMNWEKEKIERKTIEDFCWVYSLDRIGPYKTQAIPLAQFLKETEMYTQEDCGLVKLSHIRDCYLLFCDDLSWIRRTGDRFKENAKTHEFKGICTPGANDVCVSEVPTYVNPKGILYFNKDAYSIHCKEYNDYESWLRHRNTQRYVDVEGHGQQIDGKNLLHCVRLIQTGLEIATEGTINVRRPNALSLIDIRKGKVDLKTILAQCEANLTTLDESFVNSNLPDKINEVLMKEKVKMIRQEYYKQSNENQIKTSNP